MRGVTRDQQKRECELPESLEDLRARGSTVSVCVGDVRIFASVGGGVVVVLGVKLRVRVASPSPHPEALFVIIQSFIKHIK